VERLNRVFNGATRPPSILFLCTWCGNRGWVTVDSGLGWVMCVGCTQFIFPFPVSCYFHIVPRYNVLFEITPSKKHDTTHSMFEMRIDDRYSFNKLGALILSILLLTVVKMLVGLGHRQLYPKESRRYTTITFSDDDYLFFDYSSHVQKTGYNSTLPII
jgi:hypothetical protein